MTYDEGVELEPYDPAWRDVFEREALRIIEALGDAVVDVEHFGSTAIEGMLAKPVVDILVGVDELETVHPHVLDITALGYEYYGEDGVPGRLLLRRRPDDGVAVNVAIVKYDGELWRQNLLFRDFLRADANQEWADRYAERKREIVEDEGIDTLLAYSDAKADIIGKLMTLARAWASGEAS
jgi:GrpB-like predicted nucleotidyltransferase (UPF0157 family)